MLRALRTFVYGRLTGIPLLCTESSCWRWLTSRKLYAEQENEDGCLLSCNAVEPVRSLPTFKRYLLPPSSVRRVNTKDELFVALMTEAVSTSETSVNFYQTTLRTNSEDSHLRTRRRENLKSH
jgi:hypothetical protein